LQANGLFSNPSLEPEALISLSVARHPNARTFLADFLPGGFLMVIDMTESQQLLSDYAQRGSEPAFRELVRRYIDLVFQPRSGW